jgi:SPP1 family phage portal protein
METRGRQIIYANYTEKQFLSGTIEEQGNKVIDVLQNSQDIHDKNKKETLYLIDYMYGIQDIQNKEKLTRTDINHKSVENWAYAFVDWKKNFLLGKPIQYSPLDNTATKEISILNKYVNYENKDKLDLDIYEDVLVCGRGFRYNNYSKMTEEDETPIELLNLNCWDTEVVYSSGINKEQLCAYVRTDMCYITQQVNPETNEMEDITIDYDEYTVYTRKRQFVVNNKDGNWTITSSTPLTMNEHIITEYYNNKYRISLIELGKDIFDDINYVENLDLDDIEGFVNSIMVFTNAEVNEEGMSSIKEYGAVSIKSTDQKKASVELLQSRLKSLDTQIFYLRKLSALHNILSVPEAQNNGYVSNAETGKAMLTGQGFTSASIRIEGEQTAFEKCDRTSLKTILKICKRHPDSNIKELKVSDIETKFNRDMSENLLVKTQALMNLRDAQIPPQVANAVIGLFSDPVSVTQLQEKFIKEQQDIKNKLNNMQNKTNEQNNNIQDTTQLNNQGQ